MQIGWTLNFLVSLTGISLGITAILLAVNLERVQKQDIVRDWIVISIVVAVLLQILSWFTPSIILSSYWFVIAALPSMLPARVLSAARINYFTVVADELLVRKAIPSRSAPAEFNEQLSQIPRVLASHPEGLTLVEIGDQLEVDWRRLTGAASELLDRGRILKEEKKYYIEKSDTTR
jgi:hypothetical protein